MADKTFDRVIINPRERPLSSDANAGSSDLDRALRDFLMLMGETRFSATTPTGIPTNSFVSDSFRVSAPGGMVARVRRGMGFQYLATDAPTAIDGIVGLNDLSLYKPLQLSADEDINIPAADGANPRYDIIEVKCDRRRADNATRDVFNPATEVFDPTVVKKTLSFDLSGRSAVNDATAGINYKVGTPGAAPAVPATDAGYVKIATIYVPASVGAITEEMLIDNRRQYAPGGSIACGIGFTCTPDPVNAVASPAVVAANFPPGWRVNVSNYKIAGVNTYKVRIFPAGGVVNAQASVGVYSSNSAAAGYTHPCDVGIDTTPADASDVTACAGLNAGEPVSSTFVVAVGSPMLAVVLYPREQHGATTSQTGYADAGIKLSLICQV